MVWTLFLGGLQQNLTDKNTNTAMSSTLQYTNDNNNQNCKQWLTGPRSPRMMGCGVVGLRAHLLQACHDGEKTSSERHVNCLSDFLCPVGGAMDMTQYWCTDLFMATPSRFLRDLAEIKISITFHLQGQRMILSDCETPGVTSVGGDNLSTKFGNSSKWWPKSKWPTKYWCGDVFRATAATLMSSLV